MLFCRLCCVSALSGRAPSLLFISLHSRLGLAELCLLVCKRDLHRRCGHQLTLSEVVFQTSEINILNHIIISLMAIALRLTLIRRAL